MEGLFSTGPTHLVFIKLVLLYYMCYEISVLFVLTPVVGFMNANFLLIRKEEENSVLLFAPGFPSY